jgi:RNA polymerase sigma factor (sigma-70 family)
VDTLSDEGLLSRFVTQQDMDAFAVLVRRHGPMVMRVCQRVLQNAHDAEDAFQATFIVLMRKASAIGRRELLANWLYGVAYRVARNAKLKGRRLAQCQYAEPRLLERPAQETGDSSWQDVGPVLDEELNQLPEKYRAPVVLHYFEGKTVHETAQQLGWPVGTVQGRLPRARELLRRRLARRGLGVTLGAVGVLLSKNMAPAAVLPVVTTSTIQAVTLATAGKAAGGAVLSAQASTLASATLKGMFWAKLKFYAVTAAIATTVAAGTAYVVLKPRDRDLVGHYTFNEGKATRDASAVGNHGAWVGGVTATPGPKPGSTALAFDGTTGYVKLNQDLNQWLGGTATLACWIKTTQTGGWYSPCLIGVLTASDPNDVQWGWLDPTGRIGLNAGSGKGVDTSARSKQPINDGQWHHVALTRDATTGQLQVYVDGVLSGSSVSGLGIKTTPFNCIGRMEVQAADRPAYFRGALAEVRIYKRVLTSDEIQPLAKGL